MKAQRRAQSIPDDVASKMDGLPGLIKRQANTILTILLVIAAGVLFVQWRMRVAETERNTIAGYMGNAREALQQLQSGSFTSVPVPKGDPNYDEAHPEKAFILSPLQVAQRAGALEAEVESNISSALNASSVDERTKLQALQLRGDLYWTLANFPLTPESATDPKLRLAETPDAFLSKATDAFTEIVGADKTKFAEQVDGAKLSLSAIAINKQDWTGAAKLMQEVADDTAAPDVLRNLAKSEIADLPSLKTPAKLLAATTTSPTDDGSLNPPGKAPTTLTGMGPMLPPGATSMSANTMPTSVPSSMPATTNPTR